MAGIYQNTFSLEVYDPVINQTCSLLNTEYREDEHHPKFIKSCKASSCSKFTLNVGFSIDK